MLQVFPTIRSLFPLLLIGSEKHLSLESSNLGLWEEEKHQVPQLIHACHVSIVAQDSFQTLGDVEPPPLPSLIHEPPILTHLSPFPSTGLTPIYVVTSSHATCFSVIHESPLQSNHFKEARYHSIEICAAPPEQPSLNTRASNV